jgi:hypothetical protein
MYTDSATLSYRRPFSDVLPRDQQSPLPRMVLKAPRDADAATSMYSAVGSNNDFRNHFAKLEAVATDRTLWPEGAEPPSRTAVAWARAVLQQLQEDAVTPTRVVASAEGGVAICFVHGDKYSDLECLNTGEILGVTSNRRDRPVCWEIEQGSGGIAQASSRIRGFLYASAVGKNDAGRQRGR